MIKQRGLYIQVDGPDYGGKKETIKKAHEYLKSLGMEVKVTREPGAGTLGQQIREIVLNPEHEGMIAPVAELFLYMADRADHMRSVVIPHLERGVAVLQDRGWLSSFCYQGMKTPIEVVKYLNGIASEGIFPDLLLLLDVDLETARERSILREGKADRFDLKPDEFKLELRERYLRFARECPDVIKIVDASRSRDEVFSSVIKLLNEKIRTVNAA